MGISIIGLIAVVLVVFFVLKKSQDHAQKTDGVAPESTTKLFWVAVIGVLALLGFIVVLGGF
jgi:flagellar biosynthesis protein FlhB